MSDNKIGRVGFMYRPKDRAEKLGFIMGLLNYQDPREAINRCIDDMYGAYQDALIKAQKEKKDEDDKASNNTTTDK